MPHSYVLDQERIEVQDKIADYLYLDGSDDGYIGVRPTSCDLAYLEGYAAGMRRKSVDIEQQFQDLFATANIVEKRLGEEVF